MSNQNAYKTNGAHNDPLHNAMEVYGCDAETALAVVGANIGEIALREAVGANEPTTEEIRLAPDIYGDIDRGH